jgi:hypothetical protein
MPAYQQGSGGTEVIRIQTRLRELGFYAGPADGVFGGGTGSAVKAFQRSLGLIADGIVGEGTWKKLFPNAGFTIPVIHQKSLAHRCLALTGSFETSRPVPDCFAGLSGDFDGQGISFGALQWNFGQKSLQPLLMEMNQRHAAIVKSIFNESYPEFAAVLKASFEEQMRWARSIQTPTHSIIEPWRGLLKTLGRHERFQDIQVKSAQRLFDDALKLCREYSLRSERAAALMFDIKVQNGSISSIVKAQILGDFARLPASLSKDEAEIRRMQIVAMRRAEAANPAWIEDVRNRKLTIANGRGIVHGNEYDLEAQYNLRLKAAK